MSQSTTFKKQLTAVKRKAKVFNAAGVFLREVELAPAFFGVVPNVAVIHQVVEANLAAMRRGTHSTLTRAEVSGGGAKPYRQKGTGRARQGSIRAPQFVGGGVVHGPKPRDYSKRVPKKMIRLALVSSLSDRARAKRIKVVEDFELENFSTKNALKVLENIHTWGKILVVLDHQDKVVYKSLLNCPNIITSLHTNLTARKVLLSDWVVFTQKALDSLSIKVKEPVVVD